MVSQVRLPPKENIKREKEIKFKVIKRKKDINGTKIQSKVACKLHDSLVTSKLNLVAYIIVINKSR